MDNDLPVQNPQQPATTDPSSNQRDQATSDQFQVFQGYKLGKTAGVPTLEEQQPTRDKRGVTSLIEKTETAIAPETPKTPETIKTEEPQEEENLPSLKDYVTTQKPEPTKQAVVNQTAELTTIVDLQTDDTLTQLADKEERDFIERVQETHKNGHQ